MSVLGRAQGFAKINKAISGFREPRLFCLRGYKFRQNPDVREMCEVYDRAKWWGHSSQIPVSQEGARIQG